MTTALVTGATAGLGRAFVEALAERRYTLVLVARDTERLRGVADDLSARYGTDCEVLPADLGDPAALRIVEDRLADAERPIDLLVNNAGFGLGTGLLHSASDDEDELLDVLVRAVLRLSKAAIPGMVARGSGAVLNVSSVAGFAPYGSYGAAKAWVTSFTEALAVELAGTGVRAVAVCPGFVRTEFHQRSGIRASGLPPYAWISAEDVIAASLRHLDSGRRSPVVVPSLRYRVAVAFLRHAPRPLVALGVRRMRMARSAPDRR